MSLNENILENREYEQPVASDGTIWMQISVGAAAIGRTSGCNTIRHKLGVTRYILNRVDTEEDTFLELLGRDSVRRITEFTTAESRRQESEEFFISENQLFVACYKAKMNLYLHFGAKSLE